MNEKRISVTLGVLVDLKVGENADIKNLMMHWNCSTSYTGISTSCDIGFNYNKNDPVSQMVFVAPGMLPARQSACNNC